MSAAANATAFPKRLVDLNVVRVHRTCLSPLCPTVTRVRRHSAGRPYLHHHCWHSDARGGLGARARPVADARRRARLRAGGQCAPRRRRGDESAAGAARPRGPPLSGP